MKLLDVQKKIKLLDEIKLLNYWLLQYLANIRSDVFSILLINTTLVLSWYFDEKIAALLCCCCTWSFYTKAFEFLAILLVIRVSAVRAHLERMSPSDVRSQDRSSVPFMSGAS